MALFDEWNYDGFSPQRWTSGEYVICAEATGQIFWSTFNRNPAYFCAEVIALGWEDFLRDGSPVETSPDCVRAIREYLVGIRAPGSSTHVVIGLQPAPAVEVFSAQWCLDDGLVASPEVPGPQGPGGITDDRTSWRGALAPGWERVLVKPGEHVIRGSIAVRRGESLSEISLGRSFSIGRRERVELVFEVEDGGTATSRRSDQNE